MGQIGELIWGAGIVAIAIIFGIKENPIRSVVKVPICRVECTIFNGEVECIGVTEDIWNDFVDREIGKSEHNYCGACGSPVSCDVSRHKNQWPGGKDE